MKFLRSIILMFAVVVLFPVVNSANAAVDVTIPTDPITRVDGPGGCALPPAAEVVTHAIDDNTQKYLNFCKEKSGFIVTPAAGPTIVTGLRFYTANDEVQRDPASYKLEGSNDNGGSYTTISEGGLSLPAGRNASGSAIPDLSLKHQTINFSNNTSYTSYQLIFPTVKGAPVPPAMQIGEVELLGSFVAASTPTSYDCSVTKVEMDNGTSWVTIFSGTAPLDVAAGGTFDGISNLNLPAGTYSRIRVTFNNAFPVKGSVAYGGKTYYTTAATFGGQTNLASTPTNDAGDMAAFTFRNPAWLALGADVVQTFDITPVTVDATTDYEPTLTFTISNGLLLKGTVGAPATYYLTLGAPGVSLNAP